jgi:hypothetical protein
MSKGRLGGREERNLRERIAEVYSRDECVGIWYELRDGTRKRAPWNKRDGGFWEKYNHRKYVVQAFVGEFQEEHTERTELVGKHEYRIRPYPWLEEFYDAKLGGLITRYYGSSPLAAFVETGFTTPRTKFYDSALAEAPWLVLDRLPQRFWKNPHNMARVVNWLLDALDKAPEELQAADFIDNGLYGPLKVNDWSPAKVLRKAGHEVKDGDMSTAPHNYWKAKANVVQTVEDVLAKTGKRPEQLIAQDFEELGYSGLLRYYDSSPIAILREAGYRMQAIDKIHVPRGTWQSKKQVRKALIRAAKAEGKQLEELNTSDIHRYCSGVLAAHRSVKAALRFAGLEAPIDK